MDTGNWISPDVGPQGASVIQVESNRLLPILVILSIICGLAVAVATFSYSASREAEREARMLEYYLLELDAKFVSMGFKKPEESIASKLDEERKK